MTATRTTTTRPRPAPAGARHASARWIAAGGVAVVALLWSLWPSSLSHVRNLESGGEAIIAFGDSLTEGFGAAEGEDYPSRLSATLGLPVVNAGVSGDTTSAAMKRLDEEVLAQNPRIVLVGLGGNDFLRGVPISRTEQNLRSIIREIHQAGAMVVLLGFRFPSITANYEAMYERVAEEEGCLYVADLLDGILSDPKLKSDEIHPNGRGYLLMAERLEEPMRELIEAAGAAR